MLERYKIKVLGLNLFIGDLIDILIDKENILINTISPHSYGLATKDKLLKEALQNTDILVLDGLYFGLAPLLLKRQKVKKISGTDCFFYFMNKMNIQNSKVFLLGSTTEVLSRMVDRSKKEYPNIRIETFSPPFRKFTSEDENQIVEKINSFRPNIVFIGLTAPKQEILAYKIKNRINVNIICTVGNVFDWYAGVQKQPEKIWVKLVAKYFLKNLHIMVLRKR